MDEKIEQFVNELNKKFDFNAYFTKGKKYYKVWHKLGIQTCIYCFVDIGGNIYMAAGVNKPAKHIRGHISEPFKNDCCGRYGIKYLKGYNFN